MQFDAKRREVITLLGGVGVSWPLVARAQQDHIPVIGILRVNPKTINETFAEPFRRYMKALGWEEGWPGVSISPTGLPKASTSA
jgi:hypothetical protein